MIRVEPSGDKVLISLGARMRDVRLTVDAAKELAQALLNAHSVAERNPPELNRGEPWEIKVQSYDGSVWLRFYPPFGHRAGVVPIPRECVHALADRINFKADQARHRLRVKMTSHPEWIDYYLNAPADA